VFGCTIRGRPFATLQLSAGVHSMQVSKWLGHSSFTLTLDVYGDYIPRAGRWRGEPAAGTERPVEACQGYEQYRETV
jgi:integrase